MKTRVSVFAVTLALAGVPALGEAAGLGRIAVLSALGQPLRAEIELNASREELAGMVARVAAPDAFKLAGIDYASTLSALKFSIETRGAQSYVILSSDRPIRDPFVDMLIELNWPSGRLVREYTFLLDPPEMMLQAGPAPAPAPATKSVPPQPFPGAASPKPERVTSGAVPSAVAERPVEVKRGDTLHGIATTVKSDGVTLEQMLVGLYRANPAAFDGNNMNRLKSGAILNVPSEIEVAAVPAGEARREIRVQVADWNAYKRKLAGAAAQIPVAEESPAQSAQGKITPKVDAPAAPGADARDQVKVSKTQKEAGSATPEQKVAESRAAAEASSRVVELEKNVQDLQRLLELKQKAETAMSAPAVPAKPVEPAAPTTSAPPPAPTVEAPKADALVKPKSQAALPPPEPEPSFVDELLGNPAVLGGLAGLFALAGGWVAYRRRKSQQTGETPLPLAVNTLSPSSLGANSVFRATGGQSVDTSNVTPATTDFSQAGPGVIDTDEVDPVAEAEVYMAYGRDAQAEEILIEALTKDNKRVSIYLKLLEIYANRKSLKQFETLAGELYSVTGGAGSDWDKAVAMGLKLDPNNPLYSSGPTAAFAAATLGTAAVATVVAAAPAVTEAFNLSDTRAEPAVIAPTDFDFDLGIQALSGAEAAGGGDGYRFDFDIDAGHSAAPEALTVAASPAAVPAFDHGPGVGVPPESQVGSDPEAMIAVANVGPEGLPAFDFDFGDNSAEGGAVSPTHAPEVAEPAGFDLPVVQSDGGMAPPGDFGLDFPEADTLALPDEPPEQPPEAAAPVAKDDIALDFDLGFDDDQSSSAVNTVDISLTEENGEVEALESAAVMPELDLSGLSLDLDMPASATVAPLLATPAVVKREAYDAEATFFEPLEDISAAPLPESVPAVAGSFDLESLAVEPAMSLAPATAEAAADDPRWQEVTTKLDLAQAYEEMGDAEGARELLEEVIAEGNPSQQASARDMMARLG